jgi:hypothetical protein
MYIRHTRHEGIGPKTHASGAGESVPRPRTGCHGEINMRSFASRSTLLLTASLAAAGVGAAPAAATNGSDLQVALTDTGVDPGGASGSVRLRSQRGEASLQIRLRDVDASPLFVCVGADAASLTSRGGLGATGGTFSSSDGSLDFDPRGQLLAVSGAADCSDPVLQAALDEPDDCEAVGRVKLGERSELEPGTATPPASAELSYMLMPDRNCTFANGGSGKPLRKARLALRVKHAEPNASYDVCVDDVLRGPLATNAAGVGRADFTFSSGKGQGKGQGKGPKKLVIDFDAYGSHFEIRDDGDCAGDDASAVFFGSLFAPLCSEETIASAMLAPPAMATGAGEASLARSEGCARELAVRVDGLAPSAVYDVDVDPGDMQVEGVAALTTDATGHAEVVFSSDPGPGELPLDFDPMVGQGVEVRPTATADVALSGTLE